LLQVIQADPSSHSTTQSPLCREGAPSLAAAAVRPPLPTPAGRKPRNAPTHLDTTPEMLRRFRSRR
jgi:hypothetical protein